MINGERRRISGLLIEPLVRIQERVVVPVNAVAMKIVRTTFRGVVDIRSGLSPVLSGVAIAHDGRFLQFIRAQGQVAGARVTRWKCFRCQSE